MKGELTTGCKVQGAKYRVQGAGRHVIGSISAYNNDY